MKKKISLLVIAAALSTAFCFCACNGDKTAATSTTQGENVSTAADTGADQSAAADTGADQSAAATTEDEDRSPDTPVSAPPDDFPKPGDMWLDKKVGSVEKIPNCDDDKHGIVYVYDEQGELIVTIKY